MVKRIFAALGFLVLVGIGIQFSNDDPELAIPTQQSVTDLGKEVKAARRDPIRYPMLELCRETEDPRVEICR